MRLMIHIPVNVRTHLVNVLMMHRAELEKAIGEKLEIFTPHDEEYASDICDQWLPLAIEKNIVPDLSLSMAVEYATTGGVPLNIPFSGFAETVAQKYPIAAPFNKLLDEDGIFYPFSATPLTMLYNTSTVKESELMHSWEDLFNPKFRIVFPDRDKPLCRAVGAYLLAKYPDRFSAFERHVVYDGSPASVGKSVLGGSCDITMTLASFAAVHAGERAAINQPKEGNVLMPQVLVCKKGSEKKVVPVLECMMNSEIGKFLKDQGMLLMNGGNALCHNPGESRQLQEWTDWKQYLKEVDMFINYRE